VINTVKNLRTDLTVNKTISLPISIVEKVLDEAEIMSASFSEATSRLLLIAIAYRRDQRKRDEDEARKDSERILEART